MHTPPDSNHARTILESRHRPPARRPGRVRWVIGAALLLLVAVLILVVRPLFAQVPPPYLTVSLVSTTQVQIDITNAVGFANYEIYRTTALGDPLYPFTLHVIGGMGQSNFTITMGTPQVGWFQSAVGSDWDSDGVTNAVDGQPSNGSVGALNVTIDSPVNGENIQ